MSSQEEENNDRRNYGDGAVEMEVDQTYNDDMQIGEFYSIQCVCVWSPGGGGARKLHTLVCNSLA